MPRRKGPEAENVAQKGLEARLELLIRNTKFKYDLEDGREMYVQYRKAPQSLYCPPDSQHPNYQEWMEDYLSVKNHTERGKQRTEKDRFKSKYVRFLAKWDLNWGPWEYVETEGIDFPNLSPQKLRALFKQASSNREKMAERDRHQGEPGPPEMFRLPVRSWDPVEQERFRLSNWVPENYDPKDGGEYVMSEEVLNELVPGQVGKKLTLELNLTFPRDVLEELVRLNLERVFNRRKESQKRQRMDKIDFQLKVFDLYKKKGMTFALIRTWFRKRPRLSTVKSAYVSIRQKINSINTSPSTSAEPLSNVETHMTTCSQCKRAETFGQMCDQAKKFADQDYKSAPSQTSSLERMHNFDFESLQQGHKHTRAKTCFDDVKMPPPKGRSPMK